MPDMFSAPEFRQLLVDLAALDSPDEIDFWPERQLSAMTQAGVMSWGLPEEFGGREVSSVEMQDGLRHLSSACLVSTFILTQRNAACQRIATSSNVSECHRLLPGLLSGELFATVGISHLTTSRQHLRAPSVSVQCVRGGYLLNGVVPWATGAPRADLVVTGGQLDDGRQILVSVPRDRDGFLVRPPVRLMALNASQTGAIDLTDVFVADSEVLHGPVTAVMGKGTGGGAGSLGTSALACGVTERTLQALTEEAGKRPEIEPFVQAMRAECSQLVTALRQAADETHSAGQAATEQIRRSANSLVIRSAQAWLAATKGAGYVADHPAERAVRESMFFLVWSCPQPVLEANLRDLSSSTCQLQNLSE